MGLFDIFKKRKKDTFQDEFFKLLSEGLQVANEKASQIAPKIKESIQPNNHNYGLCSSNPICSSSLNGTQEYLKRLCTKEGEKFTWSGYTSIRAKVGNLEDVGEDVYTLYLNGVKYTDVYFVPYTGESEYPPAGMYFIDDERDWDLERSAAELGMSVDKYQEMILKKESSKSSHEQIDVVTSLADATIHLPDMVRKTKDNSLICYNDITSCDTILFACFVTRILCLSSASSMEKAVEFSEKYVSKVVTFIQEKYPSIEPFFEEMFDNRMSFYDRMVEKTVDKQKIFKVLVEEFEYILKTDLLRNGYAEFSESSPLPIIGVPKDLEYSADVISFFNNMPSMLSPYLEETQNILSRVASETFEGPEKNEYTLTISIEELDNLCKEVYESNPYDYQVLGFRYGKAPLQVLRKLYGSDVFIQDAIKLYVSRKLLEMGIVNSSNATYKILQNDFHQGIKIRITT